MFVIGKILKPHGVKGELRVFPSTDDPSRFKSLDKINVEFDDRRSALFLDVENVRLVGQFVLIKFKGVDGIDAAERLRGGSIVISDEQALPLEDDEYYVRDLYDMRVIAETGEALGAISDVLETGANDVYVVRRETGGDILIPAVKQYIVSVDTKARIMKVRLAEGML